MQKFFLTSHGCLLSQWEYQGKRRVLFLSESLNLLMWLPQYIWSTDDPIAAASLKSPNQHVWGLTKVIFCSSLNHLQPLEDKVSPKKFFFPYNLGEGYMRLYEFQRILDTLNLHSCPSLMIFLLFPESFQSLLPRKDCFNFVKGGIQWVF